MFLSKYFTLKEMSRSGTALRLGIDNTPPPEIIQNLRTFAKGLLDPIRTLAQSPIHVTNAYRSPLVNQRVGGANNSQHTRGFAADIYSHVLSQNQLFRLIRDSELPYDQLIDEFGEWVHVSYSPVMPRREVLVAKRVKGKTIYTRWVGPSRGMSLPYEGC